MSPHKDLECWKSSLLMVTDVYRFTAGFPRKEFYGLADQLRRCAVSVPSNIAEGAARQYNKEYIQFLYVSLGSLAELETHPFISHNLGFIQQSTKQELSDKIKIIRVQISGLIKYHKKKEKPPTP